MHALFYYKLLASSPILFINARRCFEKFFMNEIGASAIKCFDVERRNETNNSSTTIVSIVRIFQEIDLHFARVSKISFFFFSIFDSFSLLPWKKIVKTSKFGSINEEKNC